MASQELIDTVWETIAAMIDGIDILDTKKKSIWEMVLKNYTEQEVALAYKRFISEHISTRPIMPAQFMEYRNKKKNYDEYIKETKELNENGENTVPMPSELMKKFKSLREQK